jgi:hypothetical protein
MMLRTPTLLVAALVVATNSGAQVPLTIDTTFQFYYSAELMEYWSEYYSGAGWEPTVGDVLLRNNGNVLATGNDQIKRLHELPWGGQISVEFAAYGDGSVLGYNPSCAGRIIEIPNSDLLFANNRRRFNDCSSDFSFGMADIYINQRSQVGWHIFEDRSGLSAGYFVITPSDTVASVLLKVDQWGDWDSTWTPHTATNNGGSNVLGKQLVQLSNGQFLFNGRWTHYDGRPTGTIIRIHADGSQDTTFNTIAWSSEMAALHEQPDGKVVLGGQFRLVGIPDTLNLIRLNTDGSLDPSFNNFNHVRINAPPPYAAMFSGINVLEPLDAGRLFIGGSFARVDDAPRSCMACVDTSGNLLDCWSGGGLHPMNYTASGGANVGLSGLKTLANGETYIYGCYKGITDATGYHPEQVCMSRFYMPHVGVTEQPMPRASLRIWPNPGGDALYLDHAGRLLLSLELRDALGRTLLERPSILNNNPIDVSSLAPGTYVVLALTGQGERLVSNWVKQ